MRKGIGEKGWVAYGKKKEKGREGKEMRKCKGEQEWGKGTKKETGKRKEKGGKEGISSPNSFLKVGAYAFRGMTAYPPSMFFVFLLIPFLLKQTVLRRPRGLVAATHIAEHKILQCTHSFLRPKSIYFCPN